jgi:hypothetical protein
MDCQGKYIHEQFASCVKVSNPMIFREAESTLCRSKPDDVCQRWLGLHDRPGSKEYRMNAGIAQLDLLPLYQHSTPCPTMPFSVDAQCRCMIALPDAVFSIADLPTAKATYETHESRPLHAGSFLFAFHPLHKLANT